MEVDATTAGAAAKGEASGHSLAWHLASLHRHHKLNVPHRKVRQSVFGPFFAALKVGVILCHFSSSMMACAACMAFTLSRTLLEAFLSALSVAA